MGRHARALSKQGYSVIGIDRDADVIAKARALAGGPNYMTMDIRNYRPDSDPFDVAIVMSQSFGYFDPTTNRHVLRCLALGLREGGRLILDLWNPEFFGTRQGERELDTADGTVRETKRVSGGRLFVRLVYPGGGLEAFEWQLFSPKQMRSMAASVGFMPLLTCTEFNEALSACPTNPRIQFLFERDAKHRQLSFIRNDRVSH